MSNERNLDAIVFAILEHFPTCYVEKESCIIAKEALEM